MSAADTATPSVQRTGRLIPFLVFAAAVALIVATDRKSVV